MIYKKNRKFRILPIIISVILLVGSLPVAVSASGCPNCGGDYGYTLEYVYWTDDYHAIRYWCDNCGHDQNMGGAAAGHSYSHYSTDYDICDDCGHQIACVCGGDVGEGDDGEDPWDTTCYHDSVYTDWDGCEWFERCNYCDELLDYGISHGDYEYGDWEYYTETSHRRLYACVDCGDGEYEYEDHSAENQYDQYDRYEHEITRYCYDCGKYIGDAVYEEHNFGYANWVYEDDSQHSRYYSCRYCVYDDTEYADHEYVTGYLPGDENSHIVTNVCACGHSFEEDEAHYDNDRDAECDLCGHMMSRFSVTVPALLTLTVAEDGTVYAAISAMIVNNSTGSIAVTNIILNAENGWAIVPFETNMADEKVNTKCIGFRINGSESTTDGDSENLTLYDEWNIAADDMLPIDYDAVVSALSEPIAEQVLTIVFVVSWAA